MLRLRLLLIVMHGPYTDEDKVLPSRRIAEDSDTIPLSRIPQLYSRSDESSEEPWKLPHISGGDSSDMQSGNSRGSEHHDTDWGPRHLGYPGANEHQYEPSSSGLFYSSHSQPPFEVGQSLLLPQNCRSLLRSLLKPFPVLVLWVLVSQPPTTITFPILSLSITPACPPGNITKWMTTSDTLTISQATIMVNNPSVSHIILICREYF